MKFREAEELRYLAGVIDRGPKITRLNVVVRMRGSLPKMLHKAFGGTLFLHMGKRCFQVRGGTAARFLERLLPHLVFEAPRVRRILRTWKAHKRRSLRGSNV